MRTPEEGYPDEPAGNYPEVPVDAYVSSSHPLGELGRLAELYNLNPDAMSIYVTAQGSKWVVSQAVFARQQAGQADQPGVADGLAVWERLVAEANQPDSFIDGYLVRARDDQVVGFDALAFDTLLRDPRLPTAVSGENEQALLDSLHAVRDAISASPPPTSS